MNWTSVLTPPGFGKEVEIRQYGAIYRAICIGITETGAQKWKFTEDKDGTEDPCEPTHWRHLKS